MRVYIAAILFSVALEAADPHEMWEQAVAAKGGRERLHSVHSLAIYLRPAQLNLPGPPTNWLCVFPDRYFEFTGRMNARAIAVDRSAGRVAIDMTGVPRGTRPLGPDENDRLILNQLLFLLETEWLQPRIVDARSNELTVEAGGRQFRIQLDRDNLPRRIQAKHLYDYTLERYRDFKGLKLPVRVTSRGGIRQWTWDADYEIDAKYNPKIFERVPDLADGPEPWRRR